MSDTSQKVSQQAFRLLECEGVYNQLYVLAAKYADLPYKAEERLSDVWGTLYDIVFARQSDDEKAKLVQLREIAGRYLVSPDLHSAFIRNHLLAELLDGAFPRPKLHEPPGHFVLYFCIGALAFLWIFPELNQAASYLFSGIIVFVAVRWLWRRRSHELLEHVRDEISSGQFNDDMIRNQLSKLNEKAARLPSIMFDLLAQKPPHYSQAEVDAFIQSLPDGRWKSGMEIKSKWQRQLSKNVAGRE